MITEEKIEKSVKDLSGSNIVGKYFKGDSYDAYLTEEFYVEFGPFTKEEERDAILSSFVDKKTDDAFSADRVGTFYYFSTLREVLSKFEDKVKRELLDRFIILLSDLTKEVENDKKTEIEQLRTEKEDLRKQITAMQRSNEISSTFALFDSDEMVTEDHFSTVKKDQNFEFIENSSSSDYLNNSHFGN